MAEKFFSDASEPRMEREKTAACRPILLLVLYNRVVIRGLSGEHAYTISILTLSHAYLGIGMGYPGDRPQVVVLPGQPLDSPRTIPG